MSEILQSSANGEITMIIKSTNKSLEIRNTLNFGINAIGRADYQRFADEEKLTRSQAIRAMCYNCVTGYADGRFDCNVFTCPLHVYMPYRGVEPQE